jgi:site-specific DNA-methyltransferase (adenine-specific)
MSEIKVIHSDCLDAMRAMPNASVDAIVCDPPAGIAFMGKDWDKDKGGRDAWVAWMASVAREALRVIKPGGHALVWAIPRTSHWTGWAWEDGGWEPRDKIVHLFGSGFPKSLDVSKAIDKAAGFLKHEGKNFRSASEGVMALRPTIKPSKYVRPAPATDAAKQWQGWGTALKPAAEDWWLFRKPLQSTVAANVLTHGTGAINVDACRIGTTDALSLHGRKATSNGWDPRMSGAQEQGVGHGQHLGRWPANVALGCACEGEAHDEGCAVRMLDEQTGTLTSGTLKPDSYIDGNEKNASMFAGAGAYAHKGYQADNSGASRFFYTAKASRRERGEGNTHPTVKSIALMRWLVRLVTPNGGTVLDPFAGSGTTLIAAKAEGFDCIGIEREVEYVEIINRRLVEATPEWLREIEEECEGASAKDSPVSSVPTSLDDLFGFNDE